MSWYRCKLTIPPGSELPLVCGKCKRKINRQQAMWPYAGDDKYKLCAQCGCRIGKNYAQSTEYESEYGVICGACNSWKEAHP